MRINCEWKVREGCGVNDVEFNHIICHPCVIESNCCSWRMELMYEADCGVTLNGNWLHPRLWIEATTKGSSTGGEHCWWICWNTESCYVAHLNMPTLLCLKADSKPAVLGNSHRVRVAPQLACAHLHFQLTCPRCFCSCFTVTTIFALNVPWSTGNVLCAPIGCPLWIFQVAILLMWSACAWSVDGTGHGYLLWLHATG